MVSEQVTLKLALKVEKQPDLKNAQEISGQKEGMAKALRQNGAWRIQEGE